MGIDFQWKCDGSEAGPVEGEAPRRERWRLPRWLPWLLVALLVPAGLIARQARQGEEAARADLQHLVEQEIIALQAGQPELFLSLIEGTPLTWRRYHQANYFRESAWYAARAGARVRVESVSLGPQQATARIALISEQETRRGTWTFQRLGGQWRHTAPPAPPQDASRTVDLPHISLSAAGPDAELLADLGAQLEDLYVSLVRAYGLTPVTAAGQPRGSRYLPDRITIRITPDVTGVEGPKPPGSFDVASPGLALELWTPEERAAFLGRQVRASVAHMLLTCAIVEPEQAGPVWPLLSNLALWHAQTWEPEWGRYVHSSLADGTGALYLTLWAGETESDALLKGLYARYPTLVEINGWAGAMSYTMGEYLGTRYPPERLAALIRAVGREGSVWRAVKTELGLSREELETEWLAHLRERGGKG